MFLFTAYLLAWSARTVSSRNFTQQPLICYLTKSLHSYTTSLTSKCLKNRQSSHTKMRIALLERCGYITFGSFVFTVHACRYTEWSMKWDEQHDHNKTNWVHEQHSKKQATTWTRFKVQGIQICESVCGKRAWTNSNYMLAGEMYHWKKTRESKCLKKSADSQWISPGVVTLFQKRQDFP